VLLPRQQAKLARGAKEQEHAMSQVPNSAIAVIGIDLGKNSLHVVGHDARGAIVLRQKWSRGQVEARLAIVAMARKLLIAALASADGLGVFATSGEDNAGMHSTLGNCGFSLAGKPYTGRDRSIRLFLREAG
jgi:hypothetical protein